MYPNERPQRFGSFDILKAAADVGGGTGRSDCRGGGKGSRGVDDDVDVGRGMGLAIAGDGPRS